MTVVIYYYLYIILLLLCYVIICRIRDRNKFEVFVKLYFKYKQLLRSIIVGTCIIYYLTIVFIRILEWIFMYEKYLKILRIK